MSEAVNTKTANTKAALTDSLPSFMCPLTLDVMVDPVMICATGQTYERRAIELWLSTNDTCPSTNVSLQGIHLLAPNIGLRQAIDEWTQRTNTALRALNHEIPFSNLKIITEITSGRTKKVYKAHLFGKLVAVCISKMDAASIKAKEADILASMGRHPNIVRFIARSNDEQGHEVIVLDWASYGDLHTVVSTELEKNGSPWSDRAIWAILDQIASGLEELHAQGIVHKDLRLKNILVYTFDSRNPEQTRVKVSGFGTSLLGALPGPSQNDAEEAPPPAAAEGVHGELPSRWMAPESLVRGKWSEKSDVYSFGVLVWELASGGQVPWGSVSTDEEVRGKVVSGETLVCAEGVSEEVKNLIRKCCLKSWKERPSFTEVIGMISSYRAGVRSGFGNKEASTDLVQANDNNQEKGQSGKDGCKDRVSVTVAPSTRERASSLVDASGKRLKGKAVAATVADAAGSPALPVSPLPAQLSAVVAPIVVATAAAEAAGEMTSLSSLPSSSTSASITDKPTTIRISSSSSSSSSPDGTTTLAAIKSKTTTSPKPATTQPVPTTTLAVTKTTTTKGSTPSTTKSAATTTATASIATATTKSKTTATTSTTTAAATATASSKIAPIKPKASTAKTKSPSTNTPGPTVVTTDTTKPSKTTRKFDVRHHTGPHRAACWELSGKNGRVCFEYKEMGWDCCLKVDENANGCHSGSVRYHPGWYGYGVIVFRKFDFGWLYYDYLDVLWSHYYACVFAGLIVVLILMGIVAYAVNTQYAIFFHVAVCICQSVIALIVLYFLFGFCVEYAVMKCGYIVHDTPMPIFVSYICTYLAVVVLISFYGCHWCQFIGTAVVICRLGYEYVFRNGWYHAWTCCGDRERMGAGCRISVDPFISLARRGR